MQSPFLQLQKDFGEPMALVKIGPHHAVWVLTKRIETQGPFLKVPGDSHQFPIIRFEQPPELCGIVEPVGPSVQEQLREQLLAILIATCKQEKINVIFCTGVINPKVQRYADTLAGSNILLQEFI